MYKKKNKAARANKNAAITKSVRIKRIAFALGCSLLIHLCPTEAAVPGQYVAKMYTETLGRAPDPAGWNAAVSYFQTNGCNKRTLGNWGASLFSSAEFQRLGYGSAAAALLLYRAILNREPDARGYSQNLGLLDSGTSAQDERLRCQTQRDKSSSWRLWSCGQAPHARV